MEKREITIYDIAKQLNLSPSTVSRGLNDHSGINNKTKNKILKLAHEMGYRSNKFASNLRKQSTNTIGVIIPRLDSLFMSSVIAGIEKIANEASFNLIISQSLESENKEKSNARTMFNSRVDGLIVSLSNETKDLSHFETFINKGVPLIFFDRVAEELPCTKVIIDNKQAGYTATKHLIDQGCRNIVHITNRIQRNVYRDRFEGYLKALREHGITYNEDFLITNDLSEKSVINCIREDILKRKTLPEGIFISNDFAAAIAITTLKEMGIRVPQDIAVIGFNNDSISKVTEPSISTINYPGVEMGESVARILVNHLKGKINLKITSTVVLNTELIIRNSSMKKENLS